MNYTGVGVIVENKEGKFLLHLRDGNTSKFTHQWCLIGGAIENEENALDCAVREVKEETGLTLKNPTFINEFNYGDWHIAVVKGNADDTQEKMFLNEGADLKFLTQEDTIILIKSLSYSNPYLEQLVQFLAHLNPLNSSELI